MTLGIQITLQFTNKLERQLENVNGGCTQVSLSRTTVN